MVNTDVRGTSYARKANIRSFLQLVERAKSYP